MANGWHRKKPSPADTRGYDAAHRAERKRRMAELQRNGVGVCARGGHVIYPGMKLHLDHNDSRTGWIGLSCAACNVKAGARNAARVSNARRNVSRLAL